MDVHYPKVQSHGLWANHDYACSVCRSRHAVLNCNTGIFEPCWSCQVSGWALVEWKPWVPKWVRSLLVAKGGK